MADDGTLLREYAQSGSEIAFSQLVERHLGFVYSTALRVVSGDKSLAKDVSQDVFMDLARKASALSNRSVVTGWLYTSTCFAAAKAVRSECRRQAREQEAHTMHDHSTAPNPEPDWEHIRPALDAVMLELRESDREALLLRFFEKRSLSDVGNKLGLSENSARMRVERALDKLRNQLARRGITSTAEVLAVMLANQTMVAAPVGLAASVVNASVSGTLTGGGVSTLTVFAMSNAKTAIIGLVIAAGLVTPAVLQRQANTRLKRENEALRSQVAERGRPQVVDQRSTETEELERLRRDLTELPRLRGEVALLRQRVSAMPKNGNTASRREGPGDGQQIEPVTEAEITEFLQRPASEQGKLLGAMRGQSQSSQPFTTEFAHHRLLAEKVSPNLDQLESRPADIADFQASFIQTAVGVGDENKMAQIHAVIQTAYEQAVAAHLDAPSRPQDGVEDWAMRRDALDRQATRTVQQLLTPEERGRFDRLFLGVMGIDLGIGDGTRHRFVRGDGAVVFPSEQTQPSGQP